MPFDCTDRSKMSLFHKCCALFLLGGFLCPGLVHAKLFMVAKLEGEVSTRSDAGEEASIGRARWFPQGLRVFTRAKSGVEALSPGLFFRFGENTTFAFGSDDLQIHKGAALIRLLGPGKEIIVRGPEAGLRVKGPGSLFLEVVTNGGFKLVGLTGKLSLLTESETDGRALHPGEIIFRKPLDGGWSDPVHVNLEKLVKTSYLLQGFSNLSSFQDEIVRSVQTQNELITKEYRAEVGDAREADSFELKVRPPETPAPDTSASDPVPETKEPTPPVDAVPSSILPALPGPPLQVHSFEKPEPSLKDIFEQKPPPAPAPKNFPGRLLNP